MADLQSQITRERDGFHKLPRVAKTVLQSRAYKEKVRELEVKHHHDQLAHAEASIERTLRQSGFKRLLQVSHRVDEKACLPGRLGSRELFEFESGFVMILYRVEAFLIEPKIILIDFYIFDPDDGEELTDGVCPKDYFFGRRVTSENRLVRSAIRSIAWRITSLTAFMISCVGWCHIIISYVFVLIQSPIRKLEFLLLRGNTNSEFGGMISARNFREISRSEEELQDRIESILRLRKCASSSMLRNSDRIEFARHMAICSYRRNSKVRKKYLTGLHGVESAFRTVIFTGFIQELDVEDRNLLLGRVGVLVRYSRTRQGSAPKVFLNCPHGRVSHFVGSYPTCAHTSSAKMSSPSMWKTKFGPCQASSDAADSPSVLEVVMAVRVILSCNKMSEEGRVTLVRKILEQRVKEELQHRV
ncbi:hypothetical protein [Roseobacter sp. S98]|uniref:hypothetical protein n=1 Tax=Roseobacter algicola (ex Choi et al. 2025) (nom. illeg.) TaxID=3092138 RepID=UPI003F51356B